MKYTARLRIRQAAFIISALVILLCCGCAQEQPQAGTPPDVQTATFAVLIGTTSEKYVDDNYPNAKKLPLDSVNDAVYALISDEADYFVTAYTNCVNLVRENPDKLHIMPQRLTGEASAIAVNKSEKELLANIDRVLKQFRQDGTLDKIISNWVREDGSDYIRSEIPVREGSEVLSVAVSAESEPMCFIEDGEITGLDAELIRRIAYELGMRVEFYNMKFTELIPSVLSGKTPVAISNITITAERREEVDFSDDYYLNPLMLLTRAEYASDDTAGFNTLSDLEGKRIGVGTGSIFDKFAQEQWSDTELLYYETTADMIIALNQNKIDSFLADQPAARLIVQNTAGIRLLDEQLAPDKYGFAFQLNDNGGKLRDEFDEFIRTAEDGNLLEMLDGIWFGKDEAKKVVDEAESLPATNGVVRFASTLEMAPFNYTQNGQPVGMEIDLITRFCKEKGYGLTIDTASFGALLPGLLSDRYDAVASSISITEERAQSVSFSEPFYYGGVVAIVADRSGADALDATSRPLETLEGTAQWFKDKRIGIYNGVVLEEPFTTMLSQSELKYLNNYADMAASISAGQIDGFLCEAPLAPFVCSSTKGLYTSGVLLNNESYACVLAKDNKDLCDKLNKTIARLKEDGTLERIKEKWCDPDESLHIMPDIELTGENGTLNIATSNDCAPFGYVREGEFVGYDFELLTYFAQEHGYKLKYSLIDWDATTAAVISGKYDIGIGCMMPTEERAESVCFTESIYDTGVVLIASDKYAPPRDTSLISPEIARIGALTGTTCEAYALEAYPDAEHSSFSVFGDAMVALKAGKLDYVAGVHTDVINFMRIDSGYKIAYDDLKPSQASIAVRKGNEELVSKLNALIEEYKTDGTLERMQENWIRPDGSDYIQDVIPEVTDGPVLHVAICSTTEPMCFVQNGENVGFDMELMRRFAYELGYKLEFIDMQFSALVAALESGRADIAITCMAATEERRQKVDFTEPYFDDPIVLARYIDNSIKAEGFFDSLANSFYKNFLVESRWKMVVSGIGITLLLSICSGIAGIIIGFGFCLMRLSHVRILDAIASAVTRILQGTPMVVLLMILYYIVFNKTGLDGIAVSIIAFGLNFGAYASEIMLSGIKAVDLGQREAAAAIGFTPSATFSKIVFPQAARHFLPVLKGEYISLVKMTSIVGYVAVQDLTKVSDIIRSRTYEAFFPLIVTALIYFLLSFGLSSLLRLIEVRIDPKRRPRTLKGVETK